MPIKIEFKEVEFKDLKVGDSLLIEQYAGCGEYIKSHGQIIEINADSFASSNGFTITNESIDDGWTIVYLLTPVIDENELEEKISEAYFFTQSESLPKSTEPCTFRLAVKNLIKELIGGVE